MPTVTPRVAAGDDDIVAWNGSVSLNSSNIYIGNDGSSNNNGMRFTLNVPNAATIVEAYLTFVADGSTAADTVRTEISYQDADDPADFSGDDAAAFAARTRSAAVVSWDFTTDWANGLTYDSPSLTALIQALVDEAYWASGEHCVLFIDDDGSDSSAYRLAESYNGSSSEAPLLTVEYSNGGGTVTVVAMAHNRQRRV